MMEKIHKMKKSPLSNQEINTIKINISQTKCSKKLTRFSPKSMKNQKFKSVALSSNNSSMK